MFVQSALSTPSDQSGQNSKMFSINFSIDKRNKDFSHDLSYQGHSSQYRSRHRDRSNNDHDYEDLHNKENYNVDDANTSSFHSFPS